MDLFEFTKYLWQNRKSILLIFLVSLSFIVVVALILPKEFTANATILPPSKEGLGGSLVSRYSGIASLMGVNLPNANIGPHLYEDVIKSRRILEPIILDKYQTDKFPQKKVNLIEYFEIDEDEKGLEVELCLFHLRESVIDVAVNEETFMTEIRVTTREPMLSSKIAEKLVSSLEDFNQNNIQKEVREQGMFIQSRLEKVNDEIKAAEKKLTIFLETVPNITTPEAQITFQRLKREIELRSALFVELKKQEEIFKIKGFTELAPLKILDSPVPPNIRSFPKRKLIITIFMLGVGVCVVSVYLILFYKKNIEN